MQAFKYRNLCYRSLRGLCNTNIFRFVYQKQGLNKLIITRTPNEKYSLYLPADLTVEQFKQKLLQLYPQKNINITNNIAYLMSLNAQVDNQKQKANFEQIKNMPLIDGLIYNRVVVYEKGQKNQVRLTYGLEISEFNLSNRLNIPEYIQEAVAEVNYQWEKSAKNVPISKALAFENIRKYKEGTLTQQSGQVQQIKLTQQEQLALNQSITKLIQIKQFNEQVGPYLTSTNKLMKKIISYMSINWVILFYLTYAKYGWDVGEPVSYLTGLSVDLIAMMGLFQANSALTTQKQKDKSIIEAATNLIANQRMAKWRVAYLTRKLNSSA